LIRGAEVVKRRYAAGPFPRWNWWIKNPRLGAALAEELRPYAEDGALLYFVTHSNGAHIAIHAMQALARAGWRTERAVFIGAAIPADLARNGIGELLAAGKLGAAFAYCSRNDLALRWRVVWPYGHLGRVGFQREGAPVEWWRPAARAEALALTRWYHLGHSGYFAPEHEATVFAQIQDDLFAA